MKYTVVDLNNEFSALESKSARLTCYCLDDSENDGFSIQRPVIVLCPGGGYQRVMSIREGEPIAMEFLAKGYHVFILDYTVDPSPFPQALLELSSAVAYIRRNQTQFHLNPDQITVCGFSSGGHLACSLGVFWQEKLSYSSIGLEYGENRPNKLILAYPVITTEAEYMHQGLF